MENEEISSVVRLFGQKTANLFGKYLAMSCEKTHINWWIKTKEETMITLSMLITFIVALLIFSIVYSLIVGIGSLIYFAIKVFIVGALFAFIYWIVTELFD